MDHSMKTKKVPSNATTQPSCSEASLYSTNPYARDASRRAIACVTCAKAKTRCDKTLPSCSRCINKGLKCEPRSTRRTSDNNYRTLSMKKSFVSPKRFPTPSVLPSSTSFPSPRSVPSSRPRSIMRAPSHIDFRTAVKMSQQAALISGMPKLTPLPTYQSQIVDECYSYTSSPEPDLCRFTPDLEQDYFSFSRGTTPQTPSEPFNYHDPIPSIDNLDYLDCQPWPTENLTPVVGLGFDMPVENWSTTNTPEPELIPHLENTHTYPADFTSPLQMQGPFDPSPSLSQDEWTSFPSGIPSNLVPDMGALPALSYNDDSGDESFSSCSSGAVPQGEWTDFHPHVNMANMVTSAPYVPKMQAMPRALPVWEDVFMPGAGAY